MGVYDTSGHQLFLAVDKTNPKLPEPSAAIKHVKQDVELDRGETHFQLVLPLRNRFETVGSLVVMSPTKLLTNRINAAFEPLLYLVLGLSAVFAIVVWIAAPYLARTRVPWLQIGYAVTFLIMAAAVVATLVALYTDGVQGKAKASALALAQRLSDIVEFNLRFRDFDGIDKVFSDYRRLNPEISEAALIIDKSIQISTDPGKLGRALGRRSTQLRIQRRPVSPRSASARPPYGDGADGRRLPAGRTQREEFRRPVRCVGLPCRTVPAGGQLHAAPAVDDRGSGSDRNDEAERGSRAHHRQADLLPGGVPRASLVLVPAEVHAGRGDCIAHVAGLRLGALHRLLSVFRAQPDSGRALRRTARPQAVDLARPGLGQRQRARAGAAARHLAHHPPARDFRHRSGDALHRHPGLHPGRRSGREEDAGRRDHRVRIPGRHDLRHGDRIFAGELPSPAGRLHAQRR